MKRVATLSESRALTPNGRHGLGTTFNQSDLCRFAHYGSFRYLIYGSMTVATMYNSIRASRELQRAGLAASIADAIATAMGDTMTASHEELVTKDYLKAELAAVRTEIATVKNDTIRWLIGSQVVLIVALAALINLMQAMH